MQGIPTDEILAYHGTKEKSATSILQDNFKLEFAKRQAYGKGHYFSEFPDTSLGYGCSLLLCRILPGKEYIDNTSLNIPNGFNSKKVVKGSALDSDRNTLGQMMIIENSDQILPCFVMDLKA